MKKVNFLIKLKEEKKLSLVNPSQDVNIAYDTKSQSSFGSAQILLSNEKLEEAVSLIYYSMYYKVLALFGKAGIKCENHMGSIILLKELFKLDNSKILFAKTERIDKQYYIDFEVTKKQVITLINDAKEFNSMIYDFTERLTSYKIAEYREELKDSFLKG